MNESEVLESVIRSIPKSRFIYRVERAIFEIYQGEYVYIKGSGQVDLNDFQVIDEYNLESIQHKNVIVSHSLIGREGLIAIESYRLRRAKQVQIYKPVNEDDFFNQIPKEKTRIAVFYGINKSSSIQGSFWTLNSFLENDGFAEILKVETHKGKDKEHDSFLVHYKLK